MIGSQAGWYRQVGAAIRASSGDPDKVPEFVVRNPLRALVRCRAPGSSYDELPRRETGVERKSRDINEL
jgi:hypothetical protein